jgi:hypothetical protein
MKRYQKQELKCDVFVAGGGMSGVCCAIAAARQGSRVVLCQDRPMLGGNASSEIRMHIVGANTNRPSIDLTNEARESGLIEEIRLENSVRNPQRSPSMFDEILYEKCRAEPNLTLLLNTTVLDAFVSDGVIASVEASRASTEDLFTITADVFVDCTGDGALGAASGAAFTHGREPQARFGETLAPADGDHKTLGSTLLFMSRKHDRPMPFTPPSWARKITAEDMVHRQWGDLGSEFTYEYGFWWLEWGGHLDTIKDNEAIRDELLAILFGVWDYVKNQGDFAAENWSLDWFGVVPGKRESRRFIGQHILTEADVLTSVPQADAIAYGGWPIDIHPVHGFDQKEAHPCQWTNVPLLYDIPLRSCVARDIRNLMFAGRNISASHVAFASTRVMATCSVIGEGVGVAAAHAIKRKCHPADLAGDPSAIQAIRQAILREDGFLIGVKLDDSDNLMRTARLSASSERPDGPVGNIISGQNRGLSGEGGVAESRRTPGTNRWISDSDQALPAWILAEWDGPREISRVEIVFDTGLHRLLTLTQSDTYLSKMVWGQPPPETVRDFTVEFRAGSEWKPLCQIIDNGLRRWIYTHAQPLACDALRVSVARTWGTKEARIVRIAAS